MRFEEIVKGNSRQQNVVTSQNQKAAWLARCLSLIGQFLDEQDLKAVVLVHKSWRDEIRYCAYASYDLRHGSLSRFLAFFSNIHQLELRNTGSPQSLSDLFPLHHTRWSTLSSLSLQNVCCNVTFASSLALPGLKRLELINYHGSLSVYQLVTQELRCFSMKLLLLCKCPQLQVNELQAIVGLLPSLHEVQVVECPRLIGNLSFLTSKPPSVLRKLVLVRSPLLFSRSPSYRNQTSSFSSVANIGTPYLQYLDVSFTSIMNEDLVGIVKNLPSLLTVKAVQCMNLRGCLDFQSLRNHRLQELHLRNCQNLEEVNVKGGSVIVLDLIMCRRLARLSVSSSKLEHLDLSMLSSLRLLSLTCPKLHQLVFIGCKSLLLGEETFENGTDDIDQRLHSRVRLWIVELLAACPMITRSSLLTPCNLAGSSLFDLVELLQTE